MLAVQYLLWPWLDFAHTYKGSMAAATTQFIAKAEGKSIPAEETYQHVDILYIHPNC